MINRLKNEAYGLTKGKITLSHALVIAIFIILTLFSIGGAIYFHGLDLGGIFASLAVAFLTATVADFVYMYVVMKDVEEMIAQHLMLREDIQSEIMRPDKIDKMISISLKNRVGPKLAEALQKSIIDKIVSEKDKFLMESAYRNIELKNSNDPNLQDEFFELIYISKYNKIIKGYKAIFYATSSQELFNLIKNHENRDADDVYHVYKLPDIDPKILEKNFAINELKIDGTVINKERYKFCGSLKKLRDELKIDGGDIIEHELKDENSCFLIRAEYDLHSYLQAKEGEMTKIGFTLKSLVAKNHRFFFSRIPQAYPSLHLTWDCSNTNIKEVDVISAFLGAQPEIIIKDNGKKMELLIEDWVLPNSMVTFIWKLEGDVNEDYRNNR